MEQVTIIGIDLAKRVFQVHGAASDGKVVFRKKLSRAQLLPFLAGQPRCTVAMEACATAHEWGRSIGALGHVVRLLPPVYVKPFVKRQKNDVADAEAIAEAASRPTMRFVAVKTEEQQARSMIFRTRDLLVRQRTQLINALRGHLAEHGVVAPQGLAHVKRLADAIEDEEILIQPIVRDVGRLYLQQIAIFSEKITELEKTLRLRGRAERDDSALANHARDRTHHRHGDRDVCAAARGLSTWPRLRRLAWARAFAEIHGRETEAGSNLEDGAA